MGGIASSYQYSNMSYYFSQLVASGEVGNPSWPGYGTEKANISIPAEKAAELEAKAKASQQPTQPPAPAPKLQVRQANPKGLISGLSVRWVNVIEEATAASPENISFTFQDRGTLPENAEIISTPITYGMGASGLSGIVRAQNAILKGVFLTAGVYTCTIRVAFDGSETGFPSEQQDIPLSFTVEDGATLWRATPVSMAQALLNQQYHHSTVSVSDNAATYSLLDRGNLPSGATLDSETGLLTAIFTEIDNYNFVVLASSITYPGTTREVTVRVSTEQATPEPFWVTFRDSPLQVEDGAVSQSLGIATVSGSPENVGVWTLKHRGTLPSGAALSESGTLTGTLVAGPEYRFVVKVTNPADATDFHEKNYVMHAVTPVIPPPPPPPPPPWWTSTVVYTEEPADDARSVYVLRVSVDNGSGSLTAMPANSSSVQYETGVVVFPVTETYRQTASYVGNGLFASEEVDEAFAEGNTIMAVYTPAFAPETPVTEALDPMPLIFTLTPLTTDFIVPGTVQFTLGATVYQDIDGAIHHTVNPATGVGTPAGTINYGTGEVTLTNWVAGSLTLSVQSLATFKGVFIDTEFNFATEQSPLKAGGFQLAVTALDGELLVGGAGEDGLLTGEALNGVVDLQFGLVAGRFGARVLESSLTDEDRAEPWYDPADIDGEGKIFKPRRVIPQTARYNGVYYSYVPLDASILGIDAVRLPSDGRVPIYRTGDVVVILHPDTMTGTPAQVGGTGPYQLSCGRTRLSWVKVTDVNGAPITDGYTLDRAAGVLSWSSLDGIATPLTVQHTVSDLRLVTDVQINGTLSLARPLSHEFPANESLVAACLIHGDRRARVSAVWDQASWDSVWRDSLSGSAATATLNTIDFPITVTNEGCDTDRWVFRCTNSASNAWELISEKRGLVWSGTYAPYVSGPAVDVAPINPRTRDAEGLNGVPYLTIPQQANGGGWSTGNVVRINTVGAIVDFWIARSIAQSDAPADDGADGCELYALGNIDRP